MRVGCARDPIREERRQKQKREEDPRELAGVETPASRRQKTESRSQKTEDRRQKAGFLLTSDF
jgi:hypothetical protein